MTASSSVSLQQGRSGLGGGGEGGELSKLFFGASKSLGSRLIALARFRSGVRLSW